MATVELLLLHPVEHLGNEGETVKVRAGYARNYLLPRSLGVPMTRANRKQMEVLAERRTQRLAKELEGAKAIASKLEGLKFALAVKTGPGGRLFGSVTAADLLARLAEEGVVLEKKALHLEHPVKTLGRHVAKVKLHAEVSVELGFEVVSENPILAEDGSVVQPTQPTEA